MLLTVQQAADRLNLTPRHVRALVQSGALKGYKRGIRAWGIEDQDLDSFITRQDESTREQKKNSLIAAACKRIIEAKKGERRTELSRQTFQLCQAAATQEGLAPEDFEDALIKAGMKVRLPEGEATATVKTVIKACFNHVPMKE
jgi:excisionase family DNA binding protein